MFAGALGCSAGMPGLLQQHHRKKFQKAGYKALQLDCTTHPHPHPPPHPHPKSNNTTTALSPFTHHIVAEGPVHIRAVHTIRSLLRLGDSILYRSWVPVCRQSPRRCHVTTHPRTLNRSQMYTHRQSQKYWLQSTCQATEMGGKGPQQSRQAQQPPPHAPSSPQCQ
jgi:hypothetical protein